MLIVQITHFTFVPIPKKLLVISQRLSCAKQARKQPLFAPILTNVLIKLIGIKGERNLKFELVGDSSVVLNWSAISNDVPCGSSSTLYKVQWRRSDGPSVNVDHVAGFRKVISGIRRNIAYLFRVQSTTNKNDNSPWTLYTLPADANHLYTSTTEESPFMSSNTTLAAPEQLEAELLSPSRVNLTWFTEEADNIYYAVCFVEVVKQIDCKNGNFVTR